MVGLVGVMETAKRAIPLEDQKARAIATQAPAAAGGGLLGSGGHRGAGCGGAEAEVGCRAAAAGVGRGVVGWLAVGRRGGPSGKDGPVVAAPAPAAGRRKASLGAVGRRHRLYRSRRLADCGCGIELTARAASGIVWAPRRAFQSIPRAAY